MTISEPKDRFLPQQREFIKWFLKVTNETEPKSGEKVSEPCTPPRWKIPNLYSKAQYLRDLTKDMKGND
jgi:hypothetical protein